MRRYLLIITITIFASILRFYQLGTNPPSLDWDEVSLAYNAQSLLETGADEHGNTWPLTIRSFNDYKPPLYAYTLIPSIFFFGKSEFAVRLPSAIAGVLAIPLTYFLVLELFSIRKKNHLYSSRLTLAVLTSFLLAISPWHLQYSRVAFEANLGLTFLIGGILAYLKSRRQPWWLVVSALSFGLSLVSYHSTKIIIPLFILLTIWPNIKRFFTNKKAIIFAAVISLVFIGLVGRTIQQGVGQSRFNTVSFLTIDNLLDKSRTRIEQDDFSLTSRLINHRYIIYAKEVFRGYLDHFTIKFLYLIGDSIPRSTSAMSMGVLYWWTFPFLLIGILYLAKQNHSAKTIIFSWFLIAPSASALTSGTPNSVRSIFFLPIFQILIAIGVIATYKWITSHHQKPLLLLCLAAYSLIATANILFYFHMYYVHAPLEYSKGWQYGYKQMVSWAMTQKDNYDHVLITTYYDQPYIYFLWYGDYSPTQITNNGELYKGIDNIIFKKITWIEDKNLANSLLIASPEETKTTQEPIWQVNFLNGDPAFLAYPSESI